MRPSGSRRRRRVTFVPGTGITKSALTVVGIVPGIDEAAFKEAAEEAKDGCPVSGALKGNVELTLDARLQNLGRGHRHGNRAAPRRAGAQLPRDAGAAVRPCRLQRPPRGGGGRPPAEGARDAVQARRALACRGRRSRRGAHRRRARRDGPRVRGGDRAHRGGAEARARRDRSRRHEGRDRRGAPGRRRRRGRALGRRGHADAAALRRAARLQDRDAVDERERRRRDQGDGVRRQGRRRVLGVQVGGRHAPRAARADDGVAGTHPHLHRHRRRHARGRGGRGRRSTRTT